MTKIGQNRKNKFVESEVSRDQMTKWIKIRREKDSLRPIGETKCIEKRQKPNLKVNAYQYVS